MSALPPRFVVVLAEGLLSLLDRLRRVLLPPELYLLETTVFGGVRAQAIYTGARLGLFEALHAGAATPAEVALRVGAEPHLTWRLLRALASYGVVAAEGEGYRLNAVSRLLLPGTGYAEGIRFNADPRQVAVWTALPDSLRGPGSAFERVHGAPFFQVMGREPELGRLFDQSMRAWAAPTIAAVLQAWRPPAGATLVDVGGGHGHYLAAILGAAPGCRGILVDRPEVLADAQATLAPVADRVRRQPGDFFQAVPEGGDIYLLANILHDWGDADCVRILDRVRAAMAPSARLLVIDIVVPPGNPTHPGPLVDLMMMALFRDGRERTAAELALLAGQARLRVERVIPTASPAGITVLSPT